MKRFLKEFKEFALRGNVMDMAIGIIIGGAFSGIVTSLTDNFINPILNVLTAGKMYTVEDVAGFASNFVSAVVNFLIMALVIFTIMRVMNSAAAKLNHNKEEKPAAPTTKKCPYCKTEIAIDATRCPHCTSMLEETKETK